MKNKIWTILLGSGYAIFTLPLLAVRWLKSEELVVSKFVCALWLLASLYLMVWIVRGRRRRSWPMRTVMVCCAGILLYLILCIGLNELHSRFTTENWQQYPELRKYQARDFIRQYGSSLHSEDDVIRYLGKPDQRIGTDTISYWLGSDLFTFDIWELDCQTENGEITCAIASFRY
ncbi:hypothetical protein B5M42_000715 [Paenibacillus athensensis]|uniref:Uncharacterized protein n=1 Tax=Paenibacillus athensensis TaxID=1967502 RepID=A0A4Y8Q765_9BACL|nr:hypothetical protein [Paenibacillus athensensis]MCD1257356.1 hypothetical protein [Paenibacillus athensensis]